MAKSERAARTRNAAKSERTARTRKNGDGAIVTIRRKGKPNRYAAEMTLGWKDGKRIYVRSATTETKPETERLLAMLRRQHEHGIDLTDNHDVAGFLTDWMKNIISLKAKPKGFISYAWAISHIERELGTIALRRLSGPKLQAFISRLSTGEDPLAYESVRLIAAVLHTALEKAREWGLVDDNAAEYITLPRKSRKRPAAFLSSNEALLFLEAIQGERLELAMRLALFYGLRRGEVCALRRRDINLAGGRLHINGTLQYISGRGLVRDTPKDNELRTYLISESMKATLQWHEAQLQAERAANPTWPNNDYLFVSERTGTPLNSTVLYSAVKRVGEAIGRPDLTPHGLRHSAATILKDKKMSMKDISIFLGHSSTTVTESVYVHLFDTEADASVEVLEAALHRRADRA